MDGGVGENARLFTVLLCCYGVSISRVGVNRSTTNESKQASKQESARDG
jgi:hypothetical protein